MELELLTAILLIIGIDIVLGGDNAIVIALASRNLPESKRNKAIFLGTGLAIVTRIILTVLAVYLLQIPFLQFVGGLLLLYIAYNLLVDDGHDNRDIQAGVTLGAAVKTIVFADIVMGFDNVIAVAGAAHGNIYLVIIGLLFSVPIIIWGSKLILYLMERFTALVYVGGGILAFTAGNMLVHEERLQPFFNHYSMLKLGLPLITVVLLLGIGYWVNSNKIRN
ncbi:YjbE family integral membrane protein [Bacillus mesophilus]|uniref:TerC family protein n=1 Tax=Bacillus mesophilus TaxID=1808955 RepID=A0A6M0Q344_9BACI|nr:TerC family protein [Bacillus mesophilus]MBM7659752.1 YjbE family integral membrane protein [Bacillus mesophilus]NEY70614.1 TerC family protein [Bacillus mesophilus]